LKSEAFVTEAVLKNILLPLVLVISGYLIAHSCRQIYSSASASKNLRWK